MVFKCLNTVFRGIDPMVVGFNKHEFALMFGEKIFHSLRCLVEVCKRFFIGGEYAGIVESGNGFGKDGVCFIMVHYEETNVTIYGYEWKCAG